LYVYPVWQLSIGTNKLLVIANVLVPYSSVLPDDGVKGEDDEDYIADIDKVSTPDSTESCMHS
jgi:hypothetical protein